MLKPNEMKIIIDVMKREGSPLVSEGEKAKQINNIVDKLQDIVMVQGYVWSGFQCTPYHYGHEFKLMYDAWEIDKLIEAYADGAQQTSDDLSRAEHNFAVEQFEKALPIMKKYATEYNPYGYTGGEEVFKEEE
jgi:hypothetical protein